MLSVVFVLSLANRVVNDERMYQAAGLPLIYPIGILFATSYLFSPLMEFLKYLMVSFTRFNEYQADRFAKTYGMNKELISGLKKIHASNKSYPYSDWLYSMAYHDHPTLIQRIQGLTS